MLVNPRNGLTSSCNTENPIRLPTTVSDNLSIKLVNLDEPKSFLRIFEISFKASVILFRADDIPPSSSNPNKPPLSSLNASSEASSKSFKALVSPIKISGTCVRLISGLISSSGFSPMRFLTSLRRLKISTKTNPECDNTLTRK